MVKLDRYINLTVLTAIGVVLLVLAGLDLLFTTVEELGSVDQQYQSSAALWYVLYIMPRHIYELLPMATLIGALAGLGMLASGNELVAMQGAGISRTRIALSVMKPALMVIVLGVLIGEYLAPQLEVKGEVNKALARGQQVGLLRFGHWQRNGDAFMHFNAIAPEGILYGVNIMLFADDHQLIRNVTADRAVFIAPISSAEFTQGSLPTSPQTAAATTLDTTSVTTSASAGLWELENGIDISFSYDAADGKVTSTQRGFAKQNWNVDLTPDLLQVLIIEPDYMAIGDLYRYAQYFDRQGQDAAPFYLSFWKKLLQPLTTAALVFVAVSFIFGPLRQATMGSRVFTAISFGLLFTLIQKMLLTSSLVYQFDPRLAVLIPLLLCGGLGVGLLRRST